MQAKGFDTVQLVSLEAQLRSLTDDAISQPIIADGDDVTLVALSDEFRDALAAMSSADVKAFSEEWLLSDDEEIVIGEVAGLARLGQQNRKHLYVWISL